VDHPVCTHSRLLCGCATMLLCSTLLLARPQPSFAARRRRAAAPPLRPAACASSGDVDRILVLGGGFGGLYTALRLASQPWTAGRTAEARRAAPRSACRAHTARAAR